MRVILLVIAVLFLAACSAPGQLIEDVVDTVPSDGQLSSCTTDSDCVPLPSQCHPTRCIDKQYANAYERPDACTEIFLVEAAYTAEDCGCENNVCGKCESMSGCNCYIAPKIRLGKEKCPINKWSQVSKESAAGFSEEIDQVKEPSLFAE